MKRAELNRTRITSLPANKGKMQINYKLPAGLCRPFGISYNDAGLLKMHPVHIKTLDLHQMICQQLKLYMSLLNEHGVAGVFNYLFFDTTSHFIQEPD